MSGKKYFKCENCEQVHITVAGLRDRNPSCKICGGTKFEQTSKPGKGFMPMFCNWRKQHEVQKAARVLTKHVVRQWSEDHQIKLTGGEENDLVQDISIIIEQGMTSSRDNFVADNVIKYVLGKRKLKTK